MLSNEFPPLGGGMATVLECILREYSHLEGLEIDLVTSTHENSRIEEKFAGNINVIRLPVAGGCIHHATNRDLLTYAGKSLRESLRLTREQNYNIVMAWSSVPAGLVALVLQRLRGIPYVVRLTGPDIPGFEARYDYLYPILRPILRRIWRNSSAIIAKCNAEAELLERSFKEKHAIIVPNACIAQNHASPKLISQGAPLRLLCVARLIERKGHRLLFGALAQLKASSILTRLTLVGSGDLDCELQELGRQLDISELLDFRGYIARESMRDIYASHDVFVLPSFQESMSVAALEALGAGLPLILTRGGGSEEILADGLNGFLVDCGSSAGIAEAILKIERDRALIPLFSEQSRKKAHDFSWSSAAKKILATLHEVSAYTVGGEGPAR